MNRKTFDIEIKVGAFVTAGVALCAILLVLVGSSKNIFDHKSYYFITMPQVEGIAIGSTVKMAGFRAGLVEEMNIIEHGRVDIKVSILRKFAAHIKTDSLAQIGTLGVLGDKFLNITVGTKSAELTPDGGSIQAEPSKDFKDYLSKGDQVIENLNKSLAHLESIMNSLNRDGRAENIFRNLTATSSSVSAGTKELPAMSNELKGSLHSLHSIMAKIDRGEGTLGAIINDQSLYDDLKSLLGGANRNKVLKYFIKKSVEGSRDSRSEEPAHSH